jgi:DNA-directed RNA polymerase specialized sigma24 family protein
MAKLEEPKQNAADLHRLATLITGRREIASNVTTEALARADDRDASFSTWMRAWSRRVVIAEALAAVREDVSASARRTTLQGAEKHAAPPPPWVLDEGTSKSDLEQALLPIDVFPKAAVLLLVSE